MVQELRKEENERREQIQTLKIKTAMAVKRQRQATSQERTPSRDKTSKARDQVHSNYMSKLNENKQAVVMN